MKTIVKIKVVVTTKNGTTDTYFVPLDVDPLEFADCDTMDYDTHKVTKYYDGKTSGPALLMTLVLQDMQEKFLTLEEAQDILLNEVAVPFNQMKHELSNHAFNDILKG